MPLPIDGMWLPNDSTVQLRTELDAAATSVYSPSLPGTYRNAFLRPLGPIESRWRAFSRGKTVADTNSGLPLVRLKASAPWKAKACMIRNSGNSSSISPGLSKSVIVTTSWDDGDPLDLRLAELLRRRGLPGTFYVPIYGYLGRRTLRPQDMRDMVAAGFEIGAHSYSHRLLERLEEFELQREVRHCRNKLEDTTGRPITMFCYPHGRYDQATIRFVKKSDYRGARTRRMLRTDGGSNRFEIPTTLQAFPHPALTYVKNAVKNNNYASLAKLSVLVCRARDWVEFGMRTFDYVHEQGGIWHLYGHSWQVDDHRLWNDLRRLLDYVAQRDGVQYMTNGEMVAQTFGDQFLPEKVAA